MVYRKNKLIHPIHFEPYQPLNLCYNNAPYLEFPFVEEWRSLDNIVPDIQPFYNISNFGRVYSKHNDFLIKSNVINSGYERVTLRIKTGNRGMKDFLVHRLIIMAFYPEIDLKGMQIDHNNTIKIDNFIYNLEVVDQSTNMKRAYQNNPDYNKSCEKTFTDEQVHIICKGLELGMKPGDISRQLLKIQHTKSVSGSIGRIKSRQSYNYISKDYNF